MSLFPSLIFAILQKTLKKGSMIQEKICLASDNFTMAHPLIIEAISDANKGYAPAYGLDPWTAKAEELIHKAFNSKPKVLIVPTGTGANVLALKLCCKRYQSVICSDIAHIHSQETGAAEAIVGCKLLPIPHQNGKISPSLIIQKLQTERAFGKHATAPGVLSITQPTEVGTVYSLDELQALATLCKEEHLLLHMDGSRLYNAAVRLNTPLDELTQGISLDILSLGGTKNGLMCAEALLIFHPTLQEGADHLHKQNLQLLSKMRYLSAQYIPFFQKGLWQTLAMQANERATEISAIIQSIPHLSLNYPVETNQIFFSAPPSWIPLIQEKIYCHVWDKERNELRFVTSWNTTKEEVEHVRLLFSQMPQP